MRTIRIQAALAAALIGADAFSGIAQQDKAAQVMAQVRKALGGEQTVAALKSLSLRATYQRDMAIPGMAGGGRTVIAMTGGPAGGASTQVTGDIELDVEFPSRYIKVDTSTGFMAMTRTEGFDGGRPFVNAVSANPGMRIRIDRPEDDPSFTKTALERNQAELARLLLGILGTTPASFPVTYSHTGVAESSDGKADIIEVKGPGNFAARLFVDVESHLPLMLSYKASEPRIATRTADRNSADEPQNDADRVERARKEAEATPPKLVEYRLFFSDYRQVGDLSLPHRIARGTAEKTTEEWEVKSYKINPTFKPDRFKVS
jgi:hypothetical protein